MPIWPRARPLRPVPYAEEFSRRRSKLAISPRLRAARLVRARYHQRLAARARRLVGRRDRGLLEDGAQQHQRRNGPDGRDGASFDIAHERRRSQSDCGLSEGSARRRCKREPVSFGQAGRTTMKTGGAIYADECSGCHARERQGCARPVSVAQRIAGRCNRPIRQRCCTLCCGVRAARYGRGADRSGYAGNSVGYYGTPTLRRCSPTSVTLGAIPRRRSRRRRWPKPAAPWWSEATSCVVAAKRRPYKRSEMPQSPRSG